MPPAVAPAAARERLRCAPRAAWDPPRGSGRRPAPVSASARPRIRVVDAFRRASSGRRGAPRFPTGSLARGPGPSLGSAPRASRVPPDDPGALTDTTTTGVDATVDVDEADDRARDGSWSFRSLENVMVGATRPWRTSRGGPRATSTPSRTTTSCTRCDFRARPSTTKTTTSTSARGSSARTSVSPIEDGPVDAVDALDRRGTPPPHGPPTTTSRPSRPSPTSIA